jgi:hypothetical protein
MQDDAGHGRHAALGFTLLMIATTSVAATPPAEALHGQGPALVSPAAATCIVGPAGPGTSYTWNVPFSYFHMYDLVRPATCASCPGAVRLETAKWRLRFPTTCSFTVRLAVVAAGGTSECPLPDTTRVLCPPVLHTISTSGAVDAVDFTMPLPGGCCIDAPAFLQAQIVNHACAWGQTAFWLVDGCRPCEEYRTIDSDDFSRFWDLCGAPGEGFTMRLWAEASCCQPTPTTRTTWGELKAIYR